VANHPPVLAHFDLKLLLKLFNAGLGLVGTLLNAIGAIPFAISSLVRHPELRN
jgi:hypothetical protein